MEVLEFLNNLNGMLNDFLLGAGIYAPLFSTILIVIEGVFAFLPLVVFVTINMLTLGPIIGGIISWIATVLGGSITFLLCRKGISNLFQKFIKEKKKISKFMKKIDGLKFNQLVLIISIPFAPTFFINVGAGLSHIPIKKFLYALLMGRIFSIIYLGYIGVNLIECLKNPLILIKVIALVVTAYTLSKIISKKFDMDERF